MANEKSILASIFARLGKYEFYISEDQARKVTELQKWITDKKSIERFKITCDGRKICFESDAVVADEICIAYLMSSEFYNDIKRNIHSREIVESTIFLKAEVKPQKAIENFLLLQSVRQVFTEQIKKENPTCNYR